MRITAKTEYALLALIDLARHSDEDKIKIQDIAKRNGIPKKFLELILIQLKNHGMVYSTRGPDGGYRLYKSPKDINLLEVISIFEGFTLAPVSAVSEKFYGPSPSERNDKLITVFNKIKEQIFSQMSSVTIADLI
jgi:Rrf2 family cysteine metabolism transcriptional repressor